jgi:hypothetical protein
MIVKSKHVKTIAISCLLIVISIGASVAIFEMPRAFFFKSFSRVINKVQSFSFPKNNEACLMELKKQDADFRLQANFKSENGCKVEHAVRLARVGKLKIDNAPLLTCSMATQLVKFEKESIQPIAKRIFGSEAKRLKHIGSYNCRSMRQYRGVLSQHAFANALDVSGFVFRDGQSISVQRDWKVDGSKSQFLKDIASAACDTFRVSVSPDGDANHWNHLHWDTGPYRSCR